MNPALNDTADRLRHSFELFNRNGGKFRVAVVNHCNLRCFFCHNEAMANPREPDSPVAAMQGTLGTEELLAVINAYTALGGRQVNVTGGEPLAHPELPRFLSRIEKHSTRIVLNTNAVLAERLLDRPPIETLDEILASLHTTRDVVFREQLGGRGITRVMENIVALQRHGYDVCVNYSLGPYNQSEFGDVLDFIIRHGLKLKAIALVRPNLEAGFYGGAWVDPVWLQEQLRARGASELSSTDAFGGQRTRYAVKGTSVEIKNIARGRLETDFCAGCEHVASCGEGIYGLRVGVDGLWKPCLLRRERFLPVSSGGYASQILSVVDTMIGDWRNARFRSGAPD